MNNETTDIYKVQSEHDKSECFEVVLEKQDHGYKKSCNCPDFMLCGKVCNHIESVLTCKAYGL
jgi:hypothetical protein